MSKAEEGSVASFKTVTEDYSRQKLGGEILSGQLQSLVDEPILSADIVVVDPPRLPLPHHVYRFVSGIRSPRGVERWNAL
jgi:hypothetical protein